MKATRLSIIVLLSVCCVVWSFSVLAVQYDPLVEQAQKALTELGYNPGQIDGKMGNKTAAAIQKFQQSAGLSVTGELDQPTQEKLGLIEPPAAPKPEPPKTPPAARFTNPDGTIPIAGDVVVDNSTGSTWLRSPQGSNKWKAAVALCEELTTGGYDDWRLPTVKELYSLLDYAESGPLLPSDHPFLDVKSMYENSDSISMWTSEVTADSPSEAWTVDIYDGTTGTCHSNYYQLIWPVRGASAEMPSPRFTNPDGSAPVSGDVVVDQATGLMWLKHHGRKTYVWEDAKALCEDLTVGGYDDWRLPTISELHSLIDYSQLGPALPPDYPFTIDPPGNPSLEATNISYNYWTASSPSSDSDKVWSIRMQTGFVSFLDKSDKKVWWAVRGGE